MKISDADVMSMWMEAIPETKGASDPVTLDQVTEFLHIFYGTIIERINAEPYIDDRWRVTDRIMTFDFDHKWEHVRGTDSIEQCTVCHLKIGK